MSFTVDSVRSADMISARDSGDYAPHGRQFCAAHPGRVPLQFKPSSSTRDHGLPLVKALKDISLQDNMKVDV